MTPWTGLFLSSFLLLSATTSHAARRLTEPPLPADADLAAIAGSLGAVNSSVPPDLLAAAGSIPNLPPGTNLTALASNASSLGAVNSSVPPDLLAAAGSIPNLPPGTNLTALAESVPDETKAEYLSSMGNVTSPADLPAQANLLALAAGATSLPSMDIDIPDMPNLEIPDFSLPPMAQPTVSVFGHEFRLPSLVDVLGGGGGH